MATYTVTASDGNRYTIEGPAGATEEQARQMVESRLGRSAPASQTSPGGSEQELDAMIASLMDGIGPSSNQGAVGNFFSGTRKGAAGLLESAALGGAALMDEPAELVAREKIKELGKALGGQNGDPESVSYKLGTGVGSVAALLPTAALAAYAPWAPVAASGALTAAAGAGEASERARESGLTQAERAGPTARGAAIGLTNILPLAGPLSQLSRRVAPKMADDIIKMFGEREAVGIANRIRSALRTGGMEAAQEAAEETLQNLNERGYNPEREALGGVGEAAAIGAGTGVFVQALIDLVTPGRNRAGTPDATPTPDNPAVEDLEDGVNPSEQELTAILDDFEGRPAPEPTRATPEDELDLLMRSLTDEQVEQAYEAAEAGQPVTAEPQLDMFPAERREAQYTDVPGELDPLPAGPRRAQRTEVPTADVVVGRNEQIPLAEQETANTRDDADNAEIAALEREEAKAKEAQTRAATQELDAALEAKREQESEARRRPILMEVLDKNTNRDRNVVARDFVRALEAAGIRRPPTQQELGTIARHTDVQNALAANLSSEPKTPGTPPVITPETQNEVLENAIPEKQPKGPAVQPPVEPAPAPTGRVPAPTAERAQPAAVATPEAVQPVAEPSLTEEVAAQNEKDQADWKAAQAKVASRRATVTDEILDNSGIPAGDPVRDVLLGKDLTDKQQLATVKQALKDWEQRRKAGEGTTDVTPDTSTENRGGDTVSAGDGQADAGASAGSRGQGNQLPSTTSTVGLTGTPVQPDTGAVADSGRPAVEPASGTESAPAALAEPTPAKEPATGDKPAAKPKTKTKAEPAAAVPAPTAPDTGTEPESAGTSAPAAEGKSEPVTAKESAEETEPEVDETSDFAEGMGERDFSYLDNIKTPITQRDMGVITALRSLRIPKKRPKDVDKHAFELQRAAHTYFSRFRSPMTAIAAAVHDVVFNTKPFALYEDRVDGSGRKVRSYVQATKAEQEFWQGMNKNEAARMLEWVTTRLGSHVEPFIEQVTRKETGWLNDIVSNKYLHRGGRDRTADYQAAEQARVVALVRASKLVKGLDELQKPRSMSADDKALTKLYKKVVEAQERGDTAAIEELQQKAADLYDVLEQDKDFKTGMTTRAKMLREVVEALDALPMPVSAVDSLMSPTHALVQEKLMDGDLHGALRDMAFTLPDVHARNLAAKLAELVGNTSVKVVKKIDIGQPKPANGAFSPKTNTIYLTPKGMQSPHTVLHEMVHVVTNEALSTKKGNASVKKIVNLFNETKGQLSTHYGSTDVFEFVAEALSNPKFAEELNRIYDTRKDNLSAFARLKNYLRDLLRSLFSMPPVTTESLTDFYDAVDAVMAPAPAYINADALLMAEDSTLGSIRKAVADAYQEKAYKAMDGHPNLQEGVEGTVNFLGSTVPNATKRAGLGFLPSLALMDVAKHLGLPGGHQLHKLFEQMEGAKGNAALSLEASQRTLTNWLKSQPEEQQRRFHKLVHDSTIERVHPGRGRDHYKFMTGVPQPDRLDRVKAWDSMQDDWKDLGKDGQAQYEALRKTYQDLYKNLREVLDGKIDVLVEDAPTRSRIKKKLFDKLFNDNLIDPYFPLTREGDYWMTFHTKDSPEPHVMAFVSPTERDRAYRELIASGNVEPSAVQQFVDVASTPLFKNPPPTSFMADITSAIQKSDAAQNNPELVEEVMRVFLRALPETAFARSLQKREGVKGYTENALTGFERKAYQLSRQAVQLEYSDKLWRHLREMTEHLNDSSYQSENPELVKNVPMLLDELRKRVEFATNPPGDWVAQAAQFANRLAFIGTIGFNVSSAVVNTTQVPMVVMPYLAGKTSVGKAMKSLTTAGRLFTGAGLQHKVRRYGRGDYETIDSYMPSVDNYFEEDRDGNFALREDIEWDSDPFYKMPDGTTLTKKELLRELTPFVQLMRDRNQLHRSLFYDSLGIETGGYKRNAMDKVSMYSAVMFHNVERANRQVALLGSYLNELQRLGPDATTEQKQEAMQTALDDTQYTNGGAILSTAPRWAQNNIGRVAMMYKAFGIQMYYTQAMLVKRTLDNAPWKADRDKEAFRVAAKQVLGIQLAVTAMAGVQGLTLYGIGTALFDMILGGEDDELSADAIAREWLGEGLYKGGINYLSRALGGEGVDVAARIGLSNLILGNNKYNFNSSIEEDIIARIGGPFYGYTSQIYRGATDIANGEWERGVENVLPAGFRNMYKGAVRYPREGILTRRGDPILDDVGGGLLAAQFLGFAPAEYTRNQERNQALKGIDRAVNENRTLLMRKYYVASRMRDAQGRKEIWEEIREHNRKHPSARIDAGTLTSSMKQHAKTSQTMHNGVLFSPNMRRYLEQLSRDMDPEY